MEPSDIRVLVLLDSSNFHEGRPLAGLPARTYYIHKRLIENRGFVVRFILCKRGSELDHWLDWPFHSLLVNEQHFYQTNNRILQWVREYRPHLIVATDSHTVLRCARKIADYSNARLVYEVHDDDEVLTAALCQDPNLARLAGEMQMLAVKWSDCVVTTTEREAKSLQKGPHAPPIWVIPNGVDVEGRKPWGPDVEERCLCFIGNMAYAPNKEAAEIISNHIFPQLVSLGVSCKIKLVGIVPDAVRMACGRPEIVFEGPVNDLAEALRGTTMGLVPIIRGSGMKMKVLDFMAAALPVLATLEAANGLRPDGIIVEDNLDRYAGIVKHLFRDPNKLRALGLKGRESVQKNYGWRHLATRLGVIYRDTVSNHRPVRNVNNLRIAENLLNSVGAQPLWRRWLCATRQSELCSDEVLELVPSKCGPIPLPIV